MCSFLKGKERKASSIHRKRIEETITVDNNIIQLQAVEGLIHKRGIEKKEKEINTRPYVYIFLH
jgi:hypothetical protein